MPNLTSQSADPEHIAISKSAGIKIDWRDGHHSQYGLQYLRERCPCATCTGAHGTPSAGPPGSPFEMYKPKLKVLEALPVGNYAVQIKWSDGHSTGIYSFRYLREVCSCEECAAGKE